MRVNRGPQGSVLHTGAPHRRSWRGLAASWALLVAAASGCTEPCESGQARCEAKNLLTCGRACEDCAIDWLPAVPCAGACITENAVEAFCSLTEDPESRCEGRIGYCAADLQIGCRSGYPISQNRCEPPPGIPGKAECVELAMGLACRATGPAPPDAGTMDVSPDVP